MTILPPAPSLRHLSIAVTGHRRNNARLQENWAKVEAVLAEILGRVEADLAGRPARLGPVRLYNLLSEGIDQLTARQALDRGWELVAPLPFGQALNIAINALPASAGDAKRILAGQPAQETATEVRAQQLRELVGQARCFELAENDDAIAALFLATLEEPTDFDRRRAFETQANDHVSLAGRIMIERADLLIAVWDGQVSNLRGGTGHTALRSLEIGTPVLLIDPGCPEQWTILVRPEEIYDRPAANADKLEAIIDAALASSTESATTTLDAEHWHTSSSRVWSLYRGLERALGGDARPDTGLVTSYEKPDEIAAGSGKAIADAAQALPGVDERQLATIVGEILPQFAWADGISSWLSDAYRSGMCVNFVLAAFAVIVGAAYLPFGLADHKWIFASAELLLLLLIVLVTLIGRRRSWHERWFETRRVAEYLRHGPILLLLGVFRPAGKWPRGEGSAWPEHYSRHCLRSVGMPRLALDHGYLRRACEHLLLPHILGQRDYHRAKAKRLLRVNHRLDKLAETLFLLAIVSVSFYLALKLGATFGIVPYAWPDSTSMALTFLGIAFPTLGASIAGIRFFCDFERFAAISQITAGKLADVAERIEVLLEGPESGFGYGKVSEMAHAVDEIVLEELENWQAVFSGKRISLPA